MDGEPDFLNMNSSHFWRLFRQQITIRRDFRQKQMDFDIQLVWAVFRPMRLDKETPISFQEKLLPAVENQNNDCQKLHIVGL